MRNSRTKTPEIPNSKKVLFFAGQSVTTILLIFFFFYQFYVNLIYSCLTVHNYNNINKMSLKMLLKRAGKNKIPKTENHLTPLLLLLLPVCLSVCSTACLSVQARRLFLIATLLLLILLFLLLLIAAVLLALS